MAGEAVAFILLIMSMWSIGVAIERILTYSKARNQSKLYAPQVAKHLKEGRSRTPSRCRPPRTIATATSRKWCSPASGVPVPAGERRHDEP
jgi:hypothetical protein